MLTQLVPQYAKLTPLAKRFVHAQVCVVLLLLSDDERRVCDDKVATLVRTAGQRSMPLLSVLRVAARDTVRVIISNHDMCDFYPSHA